MYAIVVTQPGGPEVLRWTELPTPEPGPGEVRLRVTAAGVNRADLRQRQGLYPPPPGASDTLGLEASGVIDQIGPRVSDWAVGDAVVALLAGGGYAEQVVVPAAQCVPCPPGVGLAEAGGLMETAATVVSNFDQAGLRTGQTILIHGGAGGIGSFAIPYVKSLGLTVITTVGSPEKAAYAGSLGADQVFDYHDDWVAKVAQVTGGRGVDAILDIIGGKYLDANLQALARGGQIIVIGLQGGRQGTLDLNALLSKNATISACSLRYRPVAEKAAIVADVARRVWPAYSSGQIPLPSFSFFRLTEAASAHQRLEAGHNLGKIVLLA